MKKLIKFIIALFCNINPYYYFRHFIFGVAISCFMVLVIGKSSFEIIIPIVKKIIINDYNTEILANIIWLFFKVIFMMVCFLLSPFIAPIGLLILYL